MERTPYGIALRALDEDGFATKPSQAHVWITDDRCLFLSFKWRGDSGHCALPAMFINYAVNVSLSKDAEYCERLLPVDVHIRTLELVLLNERSRKVHTLREDGRDAVFEVCGGPIQWQDEVRRLAHFPEGVSVGFEDARVFRKGAGSLLVVLTKYVQPESGPNWTLMTCSAVKKLTASWPSLNTSL